ncbi:MAG: V-type ATPase 116kDa subunit family protein [Chloroflexota bacterium]|nr:V-type ATPase 116kDa subunit family protein [Chloroflexota bacterium]
MRRVEIVAPRSVAREALRLIHRAGVVHLETFDQLEGVGPGTFSIPHLEHGGQPSLGDGGIFREPLEEVARLGALIGTVSVGPTRLEETWALDDEALVAAADRLRPVQAQADRLTGQRVRASADLERLDSYRHLIDGLSGAVGHLPRLRGYAATGIIVGTTHRALIGLISEELEVVTKGRCEVISADIVDDQTAAVLFYPADLATEASDALGGRELEEVNLPADLQGVPFDELGPRMAGEVEQLRALITRLEDEFQQLSEENAEEVSALQLVLGDRMAETRELHRAAHSDHLVVFTGWVPTARLDGFGEELADGLGESVLVVDHGDAPTPGQEPPVAITNGPIARSFEPLSRFVAVPRYGTIDPTPLLALTFPAFVGLMIGDAGYGIVLLALLLVFRTRMQGHSLLRKVWPVGLTMAMSMIFFGVLFAEIFGETGRHVLHFEPILFDRSDHESAIIIMLVIAISIGFAQVGLGLALGVWNAAQVEHRREAIGRAALLVGLVMVVVMAVAVGGLLPTEVIAIAVASLIAATVIAALSMGIAGPVEMLGVMSNVLSYARLMAVAFAGVMLALIAEELGALMPGMVFGVLVAILLHSLNLALGIFDASIQGLRLHYVEFFTKFVEPGGTPYAPFTSVLGAHGSVQGDRR